MKKNNLFPSVFAFIGLAVVAFILFMVFRTISEPSSVTPGMYVFFIRVGMYILIIAGVILLLRWISAWMLRINTVINLLTDILKELQKH